MKKYLLYIVLVVLIPLTSFAAPPLLKDIDSPNFKHMKIKKQYKITYMFMSLEGMVAVSKAIKEWNKALGSEFFVLDDKDPDISMSTIPLMFGLEGMALPYVNNSCTIVLSEWGAEKYQVVMHELGHCIGLAHLPNKANYCGQLMHPDAACIIQYKGLDKQTIKYIKKEIKKG